MTVGITGVPRLRAVLAHAGPVLLEATLVPLALFFLFLRALGLHAALWATLGWSAIAVGRRVRSGRRLPGLILLSAAAVAGRAATMMVTGSTFLFFLQPVLGTVLTGVVFLASVPLGRPLAGRLAADFVPLPRSVFAHPAVRRTVVHLSVLWGVVHLANAGLTLFLLQREPVATFVLLRPLVSLSTTGVGIVITVVAAKRVLRACLRDDDAAPVPAAAPIAPVPVPVPIAVPVRLPVPVAG